MNVTTITSTSDTVEILFYDLQQVSQYGLYPRNQVMSGITIPTGTSGYTTVTLPSTLSFSGTGGGFYAFMVKYQNANVAPTVRFGLGLINTNNQAFIYSFGYVRNNGGTAFLVGNRAGSYSGAQTYWFSNQTTPATITAADVASRFNTTFLSNQPGFNLNVIK
jgi:predicted carbohydrate-binding protein with CBM5 and CBM33 domain